MNTTPRLVLWSSLGWWGEPVGWHKWVNAAQPQTGCLEMRFPEIPRLDYLILLAVNQLFRVAVHDRVLRIAGSRVANGKVENGRCLLQFIPAAWLGVKPTHARIGHNPTLVMIANKIPRVLINRSEISLYVKWAFILGR